MAGHSSIRTLADALPRAGGTLEKESHDELWRAVFRLAYTVARSYGFDHEDGEDIAQELTIRAVRQTGSATINASWVCRGAAYFCIDQLRARQAERNAAIAWADEQRRTQPFVLPPSIAVLDLHIAMERLPASGCQALIEHFWAGRSWREIDERYEEGARKNQYRAHLAIAALMSYLLPR